MPISVDIQAYIKSLDEEWYPRAVEATKRGIYKFCLHVLSEAQELCPVQWGDLKASAKPCDPEEFDALITCTMGFNMRYAAAVHECINNKFSGKLINHPQGQAKFLETALFANAERLIEFIKEEWKAEGIGGAG